MWFDHLSRMSPGWFPRKMLWECPTKRRPWDRPRTYWWDGTSRLEELEEVEGDREAWASLLRLLPPWSRSGRAAESGWMDGWTFVKNQIRCKWADLRVYNVFTMLIYHREKGLKLSQIILKIVEEYVCDIIGIMVNMIYNGCLCKDNFKEKPKMYHPTHWYSKFVLVG